MTPPAHTRETRGLASEIKFLVDPSTGGRIRDWARARLQPDPYGEGPFGDEYHTTSLYFDTPEFDVFRRNGSYGRSKYRIRRYDGLAVAFLERKLRRGTRLNKRRSLVPIEDLLKLDAGTINGAWAGSWFEQRLLVRRLRPVCQIGYRRMARVEMRDTGPIRLTLDEDLRVLPRTHVRFGGDHALPALPEMMVLELKYREVLPALFKQLVEEFTLMPRSVSKYRFAIDALGLFEERVQEKVLEKVVPEDTAATPTRARLGAPGGDATYA